jgi:hypothetical protein
MICLAKPGLIRLVPSAKGRNFSNMLYVSYVHLTKKSLFTRNKPVFSLERIVHEKYVWNGSVANKKSLPVFLKEFDAKTN